VRTLLRIRGSENPGPIVNLSLVVVQQNIHEVARFVELGNELGVQNLYVRTLMPNQNPVAGLNYHVLPPYLHPNYELHKEKAIQAIAASRVKVIATPETWDTPIFPPETREKLLIDPPRLISRTEARTQRAADNQKDEMKTSMTRTQLSGGRALRSKRTAATEAGPLENPYGRTPRFSCRYPYQNLNLNDFEYRLSPCCYMSAVPDYDTVHFDGSRDFFDAWNSPAMVELRRRLRDGPLFSYCLRCP
jgi:hypothetical protein